MNDGHVLCYIIFSLPTGVFHILSVLVIILDYFMKMRDNLVKEYLFYITLILYIIIIIIINYL